MTCPMQKTACKKHILIYIYEIFGPRTPPTCWFRSCALGALTTDPKSVNSATSLPYATSGMADHAQAPEIGQFQHGGALPGRTMRARGRSTARHQPRDASVRWCASVPRQKPTRPARPKGVVWVGCTRATPLLSPTPGIRLA